MTQILSINGGSSSIKFALFEINDSPRRLLGGRLAGIGESRAKLIVRQGDNNKGDINKSVRAPNYASAVNILMDWVEESVGKSGLAAVGHRVVHGGPKYWKPQRITPAMLEALRQLSPFDPEHLPEEISLIEAFQRRFPKLPQVACFDTQFHHDLPRVAQLLPIPRRYFAKGIRRYGFHGLSYTFLMEELERLAGREAARGRIVLAHLGNGASLAAVAKGKPIDTSMALTPAAGMPMSTRSGDLDPGLVRYLSETEDMSVEEFNEMINRRSGLLGISETTSSVKELLALENKDTRAAEALRVFSYGARKWIGAFAAALGGLDTLIFSGGIGENSSNMRSRICSGLGFLGVELDEDQNAGNAPIVSKGVVTVRVIPTDEERVIATMAARTLRFGGTKK